MVRNRCKRAAGCPAWGLGPTGMPACHVTPLPCQAFPTHEEEHGDTISQPAQGQSPQLPAARPCRRAHTPNHHQDPWEVPSPPACPSSQSGSGDPLRLELPASSFSASVSLAVALGAPPPSCLGAWPVNCPFHPQLDALTHGMSFKGWHALVHGSP